ncbi:MAG: hypothetical protein Q4D62_14170 [Planctomycetia bacterium]|nr:hypothetical protein [Planctomycetia bacterium]
MGGHAEFVEEGGGGGGAAAAAEEAALVGGVELFARLADGQKVRNLCVGAGLRSGGKVSGDGFEVGGGLFGKGGVGLGFLDEGWGSFKRKTRGAGTGMVDGMDVGGAYS